jgi:polysaccharide biosynthesis transport protein
MTTLPQTAPVRLPRTSVPSQVAVPGMTAPALHAGHVQAQGMTGADVWRILRANLWLIVIMLMAAAVGGYLINSYLAKNYSRYTAVGLMTVRVQPEVPVPGKPEVVAGTEAIALQQNTQAKEMKHESLFMAAIADDESKIRQTGWWRQFQGERDPLAAAKKDIDEHFEAEPVLNSRLLRVSMTYSDPDDAKTIVEEMVNKHIELVKKDQFEVETKKVDMLTHQLNSVKLELNEDVMKQEQQKERELGTEQVGTSTTWNGAIYQLDRLMQEESKIQAELAGLNSRYNTLTRDLEDGRTPAEVEQQINQSMRYLNARQRLDDIDVELDGLIERRGDHDDLVISWKHRRQLYQQKLDETREELKSTYAETVKSMYKNEIDATSANIGRLDQAIKAVSEQLSKLNTVMTEYRMLQERERELRTQQSKLTEEISNLNQFALQAPWATAEWASRPQKPDRPSFPKLQYSMAIALFCGLALSLGIAFLREMTDTTVRSPRDLAKVGQLNLLGMIPHEADDPQAAGSRLHLAIFDAPHSMLAEQFRQVRGKLQHMASLDTTRSIVVTSPSPGDGKTTVACNLAAALALNGRRILLVDANFRRPQLHAVFGLGNEVGFADVLNNPEALAQAARDTDVPNLSVLPSGPRPANPTELLESQLFADFIERALEHYDHVVFDAGPLLMVSDAIAMAPRVDGVVTVVRARGNSRGLLQRMRDELRKLNAEHLGVVLNAVRSQGGGYYGRNIKTYYAYQNG